MEITRARYVSTAEGAKLFGRSRHSILRSLKRGLLPGFRRGRVWVLDLDAVAALSVRTTESAKQ